MGDYHDYIDGVVEIPSWILDEDKIHAQIQANKAQPKKEGKFQKRMREMMEQAQAQQQAQGRNQRSPEGL